MMMTKIKIDLFSNVSEFWFFFFYPVPDQPSIHSIESGYDFANVSWLPSGKQSSRSPGREFFIEYRQIGEFKFQLCPILFKF